MKTLNIKDFYCPRCHQPATPKECGYCRLDDAIPFFDRNSPGYAVGFSVVGIIVVILVLLAATKGIK